MWASGGKRRVIFLRLRSMSTPQHHHAGGAPSYNWKGWYDTTQRYSAAKVITANQRYPDQVMSNASSLGQGGIFICAHDNGPVTIAAAASISNVSSLSTSTTTLDGYTLRAGDLVFLMGQTTASQNGLWQVSVSGNWTRPAFIQVLQLPVPLQTIYILVKFGATLAGQNFLLKHLLPVAAAAIASNISPLSTATTTLDSYTLLPGDRVLLLAQTVPTENGLWEVPATSGNWFRPQSVHTVAPAYVSVCLGSTNANKVFQLQSLPTGAAIQPQTFTNVPLGFAPFQYDQSTKAISLNTDYWKFMRAV